MCNGGMLQHMKFVLININIAQVEHLQKSIVEFHKGLMDIKETLLVQQQLSQKQIVESKSKTVHRIRTTSFMRDNNRSEFDEQVQQQLERDLGNEPEIADRELEEDLNKMEKSKST
jgi:hypothetical protein